MSPGRLLWLAWERREDGSVRVLETREGQEGHVREQRRFPGLEEATDVYGPDFRELVEEVLASGSDRGRFRP